MHVNGHLYPPPHPGWGPIAEELFFYTSRYFQLSRGYLERLGGGRHGALQRYRAGDLNGVQRMTMAWLLACPPTAENAQALLHLCELVAEGQTLH